LKGVKVLDSWALLAYFEGEEAGAKVAEIFKEAAEAQKKLLISVINWGEVLYITESRYGEAKRNEVERLMNQMHLEVVDVDKDLTREAARLKANAKLPYADSFAAALARLRKAILITGDQDFKSIESQVKIAWLQ
jgi:ribonuclease VapC